jgi:hypothetical protein
MVKTSRVTDRRELRFSSAQEILDDVEYLDSGDPPRTTGNWTGGQIVEHVTRLIDCSIDGFPVAKGPLLMRVVGRLTRRRVIVNPLQPGLIFSRKFDFLAPGQSITWEEAVEHMRETMMRLSAERMSALHPLLGRLTHEQWEQFHCRHAEMHFSFMHPA